MSSTVLALAMAVAVGQDDMTSTPEEFQEFGNLMVGRWSGDVTLIADWPGMKKKAGEKLIIYRTSRWVADGKGFIDTSVGGETTDFALWLYEPISRRILLRTVSSEGGGLQAVLWKESATKWPFKITGGGLADGRKQGGEGHFRFEDAGHTLVGEGNLTLGGKALPKLHDVYTRLDK